MPSSTSAFQGPAETYRLIEGALPDRNGGINSGRGVITPTITTVVRNGKTVTLVPWEYTVLPDGSIRYVDENGVVWSHIDLPATDIPGVTADSGLQYRSQRWYAQDGVPVQLDDFVFDAPGGGLGSLSSLVPVAVVEGVQITRGEQGPVGPAPTLTAGIATVVAPGSVPVLSVRPEAPGTYALDVAIPAAAPGPAGAPGQIGPAGMTWCGPWDAERDYVDTDVVSFNRSSWFAADNPPVGEVPSDASLFWNVLSVHGAQGDPGLPGADGASAPLPVFTASVTTLAAGEDATVDVSGVYPNVHLALGAPRGADGGGGGSSEQTTGWLRKNSGFYLYDSYYSTDGIFSRRTSDRVEVLIANVVVPEGMAGPGNYVTAWGWNGGAGFRPAGKWGDVTGVVNKAFFDPWSLIHWQFRIGGGQVIIRLADKDGDGVNKTLTGGVNIFFQYNTADPFPEEWQWSQMGDPSELPAPWY